MKEVKDITPLERRIQSLAIRSMKIKNEQRLLAKEFGKKGDKDLISEYDWSNMKARMDKLDKQLAEVLYAWDILETVQEDIEKLNKEQNG